MTNERAIPFLNGKAMAAMFSWKGTEGIFFHIPAISKNQVFFMDFGNGNRQQNNTQFFKITGQSKTDDIWMAHGWLVQERTDCARKDTRYIRK